MSWLGSNPSLQSIMLNSHMDVVPVFPVCKISFTLVMSDMKYVVLPIMIIAYQIYGSTNDSTKLEHRLTNMTP